MLSWLRVTPSWGTPSQDWGTLCPLTRNGVPPEMTDTSHWVPSRKDMGPVEVLWDGDGVPPGKDMRPVEVLWDGDAVPLT